MWRENTNSIAFYLDTLCIKAFLSKVAMFIGLLSEDVSGFLVPLTLLLLSRFRFYVQ